MESPPVQTVVLGHTLHIRLNRPAVRNAINQEMATGVAAAIDHLESVPSLRVAVIDGADNTFCSGMDLRAYLNGERPVAGDRGLLGFAKRRPSKPLIAAVEGYAIGAGFEATLSCDLVVAAETATFALPEVQRGLLAGGGGTIHLGQRLPRALASDIVLTGRRITAAEAATWGLISRVTAHGEALKVALEIAESLAGASATAVSAARDVLAASRTWSLDEAYDRQEPFLQEIIASPEAREGASKFVTGSAANRGTDTENIGETDG